MDTAQLKSTLGPWRYRWYWLRSLCFQVSLVIIVLIFAPPIMSTLLIPERARWKVAYPLAKGWCQSAMWLLR
ncbi:MAG: hypothetical protein AAFX85_20910, partial [Pseudomonadota bacterium]